MIYDDIEKLIGYGLNNGLITKEDVYVIRNEFMQALILTDWENSAAVYSGEEIDDILAPLIDYAVKNGIIYSVKVYRIIIEKR